MADINNKLSLAHENMFVLTMTSIPDVSLLCNAITLPGINVNETIVETSTLDISSPSTKLTYEPFMCRFLVNEDYTNWREVFNLFKGYQTGATPKTDFSVVLPNNHGKAGYSINYSEGFVLSLDGIDLIANSTAEVVTCGLSIKYTDVDVEAN